MILQSVATFFLFDFSLQHLNDKLLCSAFALEIAERRNLKSYLTNVFLIRFAQSQRYWFSFYDNSSPFRDFRNLLIKTT